MKTKTFATCIAVLALLALTLPTHPSPAHAQQAHGPIFSNPIGRGGDPYIVHWNGAYYYMDTDADNAGGSRILIRTSPTLEGAPSGQGSVIWTPGSGQPGFDIWDASLHDLGGVWYMYFAADGCSGCYSNHTIYALKGPSDAADPTQGPWTFAGAVDPTISDVIGPDVFVAPQGAPYPYYMVYNHDLNVSPPGEGIYIAGMTSPTALAHTSITLLTTPNQTWEDKTTEGPRVLQHGGKTFITYMGNEYYTCDYAMGLLTFTGGGSDFLNAANWAKHNGPVFAQNGNACGPGRTTFTTSPDGTQSWMVYESNVNAGSNAYYRDILAQSFSYDSNGNPVFGAPIQKGTALNVPSGENAAPHVVGVAVGADNQPRVLWDYPDGHIGVWTFSSDGSQVVSKHNYGPLTNWWGQGIAVGADNQPRVLWDNADGSVSVWDLSGDAGSVLKTTTYGPYSGWYGQAIGVGKNDNLPRVLWDNTDGTVSVWDLSSDGSSQLKATNYGPFDGWTGQSIAVGQDNLPRVLWDYVDGTISLRELSGDGSSQLKATDYGPFTGWNGQSIDVGYDNLPRVAWDNVDGAVSVWEYSSDGGGQLTATDYGPFSGWSGRSIAVGQDNLPRALWDNTNGTASLWTLSSDGTSKTAAYDYTAP